MTVLSLGQPRLHSELYIPSWTIADSESPDGWNESREDEDMGFLKRKSLNQIHGFILLSLYKLDYTYSLDAFRTFFYYFLGMTIVVLIIQLWIYLWLNICHQIIKLFNWLQIQAFLPPTLEFQTLTCQSTWPFHRQHFWFFRSVVLSFGLFLCRTQVTVRSVSNKQLNLANRSLDFLCCIFQLQNWIVFSLSLLRSPFASYV